MGVCRKQVFQPVGLMSSSAAKEAWSWVEEREERAQDPLCLFSFDDQKVMISCGRHLMSCLPFLAV